MLQHMDDDIRAELFSDAPEEDAQWIGLVYKLDNELEVVPLQFLTTRFFMFFSSVTTELGGDTELVADMAQAWTGGFIPAPSNRMVKFLRADATDGDTIFNPAEWHLGHPLQIFQFGTMLIETLLLHAGQIPEVTQYFYKPQGERLERFYRRIFQRNEATCTAAGFAPILAIDANEGGFYGFNRTQS